MFELLVCIVPKGYGEKIALVTSKNGATGGTLLLGKGTAPNIFLDILGLCDTSKDLLFVVTDSEQNKIIIEEIKKEVSVKKQPFGVLFVTKVLSFIKEGKESKMENVVMQENFDKKMIMIIVNKGFSEDVMVCAKKAGATGGTILNARGTAKEDDEKFFGLEIVPEKDMVLILAENKKADEIIEAVKNLECLKKPGVGVCFSMPAKDFTVLGK